MRNEDDFAALPGDFEDGRRQAFDPRDVGNLAGGHRHVEVNAHEHALTIDVGVIETAEGVHVRARWLRLVQVSQACPSPPRYRPCDWRSPTRYRTTTSPAPV